LARPGVRRLPPLQGEQGGQVEGPAEDRQGAGREGLAAGDAVTESARVAEQPQHGTPPDSEAVGPGSRLLPRRTVLAIVAVRGDLNEIYYPTIDRPQVRDLQYLVTDGETFFHDERRGLNSTHEYLAPHALGFRVINADPGGRYRLVKDIITGPHHPCLLIHTR